MLAINSRSLRTLYSTNSSISFKIVGGGTDTFVVPVMFSNLRIDKLEVHPPALLCGARDGFGPGCLK